MAKQQTEAPEAFHVPLTTNCATILAAISAGGMTAAQKAAYVEWIERQVQLIQAKSPGQVDRASLVAMQATLNALKGVVPEDGAQAAAEAEVAKKLTEQVQQAGDTRTWQQRKADEGLAPEETADAKRRREAAAERSKKEFAELKR